MDTINKKTTSQMGNQDDIHLFAERGGEGRGSQLPYLQMGRGLFRTWRNH